MGIVIDNEFKGLIPPLETDEYLQLEKNILADGIRDPLVVWHQEGKTDDILIDGHNRLQISQLHGNIPYQVVRKDFGSRNEAMCFIIDNQLGRRNINAYVRSELALKKKPLIAEQAKKKQATHTEQGYQKSDKAVDTNKQIAKIAGVSHDTIHKVEVISEKAPEEVKQQLRKGDMSINQAYKDLVNQSVKQKDFVKDAKERHEQFKENKQEKIVSFNDAQQDKRDKKILAIDLSQKIFRAIDILDNLANLPALEGSDENYNDLLGSLDDDSKKTLYNGLTRMMTIAADIRERVKA